LIYHQDCFHRGVTEEGFPTGMRVGSGVILLNIEENSVIRKCLILVFSTGKEDFPEFILKTFSSILTNSTL